MGEAQANKWEKEIKMYAKQNMIVSGIVRLRKKKFDSLSAVMRDEYGAVEELLSGKNTKRSRGLIKQAMKNETLRNDVIDPTLNVAKDAVGNAIKGTAKQGIRNLTTRNDKYVRLRDNVPERGKHETSTHYQRRLDEREKKLDKMKAKEAKKMTKQAEKATAVNSSAASFLSNGKLPF